MSMFKTRLFNSINVLNKCSYRFRSRIFIELNNNTNKFESFERFPILEKKFHLLKSHISAKIKESQLDKKAVYANNELDLSQIDIYGFDYDYTLAVYKRSLGYFIYNVARDFLVTEHKYPIEIKMNLNYIPDFAIRGLHYDIENGLLMKIDSFHQIQMGSVYRGLSPVSDDEVLRIYGDAYISQSLIRPEAEHPKMKQLNDLFSVPEICLLSNVTQYFIDNGISYHPEIIFYDVQNAVRKAHLMMHKTLNKDVIEVYLEKRPDIVKFLNRLKDNGKKTFLITNSPFHFIDVGLRYMIGDDWTELFDLIIVHARKPKFFLQNHRPFRCYDPDSDSHTWELVKKFEKNKVYVEGTVKELLRITGWRGNSILYFGDQIYNDLADLTLYHGWRTGAVIKELENEIEIISSEEFSDAISNLQAINELIDIEQKLKRDDDRKRNEILHCLLKDRQQARHLTKYLFNAQFGSIFRTHHNPTYFSRRLFRYSDIYTSDVTNLLDYSLNHLYCPRRGFLPHEKVTNTIRFADQ